MRRIGPALVAVWYLLAASNVHAVALQRALPLTKTVEASADFPCAEHDCGCRTAEQCRQHCCCYGVKTPPAKTLGCHEEPEPSSSRTVRVSYLSVLYCVGGGEGTLAPGACGPHVPAACVVIRAPHGECAVGVDESSCEISAALSPLDKVPILRSFA